MRTAGALAILTSLRPESDAISSELGERGDVAFMRMQSSTSPQRWALVSSPGDRWFSLDVDGGFCLAHGEEETSDQDVQRLLQEYVDLALHYLREGATPYKAGRWGFPAIQLSMPAGGVVLRRSLVTDLKSVFRFRHHR